MGRGLGISGSGFGLEVFGVSFGRKALGSLSHQGCSEETARMCRDVECLALLRATYMVISPNRGTPI